MHQSTSGVVLDLPRCDMNPQNEKPAYGIETGLNGIATEVRFLEGMIEAVRNIGQSHPEAMREVMNLEPGNNMFTLAQRLRQLSDDLLILASTSHGPCCATGRR